MRVDLWISSGVLICGMLALPAAAIGQTVRPCQCNSDCVLNPGAVCVSAPDTPFEGKCCPGSWKCPDATGPGQTCGADAADRADVGTFRDTDGTDTGGRPTGDAAEVGPTRDTDRATDADSKGPATGRDVGTGGVTWQKRASNNETCACRASREGPPPLGALVVFAAAFLAIRSRRRTP